MHSKRVLRIVVVVAVTILAILVWQLAWDRVWPASSSPSDVGEQRTGWRSDPA